MGFLVSDCEFNFILFLFFFRQARASCFSPKKRDSDYVSPLRNMDSSAICNLPHLLSERNELGILRKISLTITKWSLGETTRTLLCTTFWSEMIHPFFIGHRGDEFQSKRKLNLPYNIEEISCLQMITTIFV